MFTTTFTECQVSTNQKDFFLILNTKCIGIGYNKDIRIAISTFVDRLFGLPTGNGNYTIDGELKLV